MCYFLTVALPEAKTVALTTHVPRGFAVWECENRSIARSFPAGFRSHLVTSSMCSCDLFRRPWIEERSTAREDRLRRKYARQGWSQAKIARALTPATVGRHRETFVGLRPDLRTWLAGVARGAGELALVVHFYNGSVEEEVVPLSRRVAGDIDSFEAGQVPILEDQRMLIRRSRGKL
jgi:hypothetical protein